jgi:Formyl transferase
MTAPVVLSAGPVIVLSGSTHYAQRALAKYAAAFQEFGLLVVEERPNGSKKLWTFLSRRSRRRGLLSALDAVLLRIFQAARVNPDLGPRHEPDLIVGSVNEPRVADFIERNKPRAVLLTACSIVNSTLIARINAPILNVHNGVTPRYRGSGNTFAMAEDNFDLIGATLHRVDAGIDTGARLSVTRFDPVALGIPIEKVDDVAFEMGADLAIAYVTDRRCHIPAELDGLADGFYPYPGFSDWIRAKRNYRRRQRDHT